MLPMIQMSKLYNNDGIKTNGDYVLVDERIFGG